LSVWQTLQAFGIFSVSRIAWCDKVEGVATDTLVGNRFRDLRHVTSGAFAARTSGFVVRMLLEGHRMGSDLGIGAVAIEAQGIAGLAHHGDVFAPMWVMATEAGDPARAYIRLWTKSSPCMRFGFMQTEMSHARGPCHPKMAERRFAELVVLKLPVIRKVVAYFEPHRPIVVLSADRIGERLTLGMTLNADVIGMNTIEPPRIEGYCGAPGGSRALRQAHGIFHSRLPFGDGLAGDIVIHRVAAVAKRTGRALKLSGG
jgi:hypothetical protein